MIEEKQPKEKSHQRFLTAKQKKVVLAAIIVIAIAAVIYWVAADNEGDDGVNSAVPVIDEGVKLTASVTVDGADASQSSGETATFETGQQIAIQVAHNDTEREIVSINVSNQDGQTVFANNGIKLAEGDVTPLILGQLNAGTYTAIINDPTDGTRLMTFDFQVVQSQNPQESNGPVIDDQTNTVDSDEQ